MEPQDTITIAPSVLIEIIRHAATQTDGVASMGNIPVRIGRVLSGHPMGSGTILIIDDDNVTIDVYLVVLPNVDMRAVSHSVQEAVNRAIEELVGMHVEKINVHIENVLYD